MILDGNSDKIRFENVTIENAYGWTLGKNGQAEALYINNKSAAFINCRVLSFQDTLLPGGGYNWFKDCFIAGATDFIWGRVRWYCLKIVRSMHLAVHVL